MCIKGGRHSSVDLSAPNMMRPGVRIPTSTQSKVFYKKSSYFVFSTLLVKLIAFSVANNKKMFRNNSSTRILQSLWTNKCFNLYVPTNASISMAKSDRFLQRRPSLHSVRNLIKTFLRFFSAGQNGRMRRDRISKIQRIQFSK